MKAEQKSYKVQVDVSKAVGRLQIAKVKMHAVEPSIGEYIVPCIELWTLIVQELNRLRVVDSSSLRDFLFRKPRQYPATAESNTK